MMAAVQPEQIQYYGAKYDGSPDFEKATNRIQEKVRMDSVTLLKSLCKFNFGGSFAD